jgi:hypothetical protein
LKPRKAQKYLVIGSTRAVKTDKKNRAKTFPGIAKAIAEQWTKINDEEVQS